MNNTILKRIYTGRSHHARPSLILFITMKLINILKEAINASEAYTDVSSIQTIIDGKRGVAFISKRGTSSQDWETIQKMIADNSLKSMHVKHNPNEAYVVYAQGYANDAAELKHVAEKYGGYLSSKATEEDSRRIGQLLGYNDSDIEDYIERNKTNQ